MQASRLRLDVGSSETELRRPTCPIVQVIIGPARHLRGTPSGLSWGSFFADFLRAKASPSGGGGSAAGGDERGPTAVVKDRVSLRSTHPAPCSRLRQQLISLRCGPLQSRFARQLPQRGSLYPDHQCVFLFHTGAAQNRPVGAGFPRPAAGAKICCHPEERSDEGSRMVTHGVLFTGFFTAARFRMTGGWEPFCLP